MGKRFVYFYFMKNDPVKIQQVVPSHIKYWKESNLKNYMGDLFQTDQVELFHLLQKILKKQQI